MTSAPQGCKRRTDNIKMRVGPNSCKLICLKPESGAFIGACRNQSRRRLCPLDANSRSGRRSAKVVGANHEPFELAGFLAIHDAFADQWQPNGGIESAIIDMLAIAFSLQMYWSTIAHQRALRTHNDQSKELNGYENKGWKSPYQYEADAIQ